MTGEPASPSRNQQKPPRTTLAGAYVGFVTFGVLNVLAFVVMTNGGAAVFRSTALVGAGLLAVVTALAAWAYVGWGRPGFAGGLVGGYALMTIMSGGSCTLFVPQLLPSFNFISGALLCSGAVLIFGLALLIRRFSRAGWM